MDKQVHDPALRVGNTDAAALAASGVAIVLTTYLDEGQYELLGALVSLTLTGTLLAYLWGSGKSGWQTWAFGAVVGLSVTPLAGFVLELMWSENWTEFFAWRDPARKVADVEASESASRVGSGATAITWLVVTVIVACSSFLAVGTARRPRGGERSRKAAKKVDPGSSPG